MQATARRLSVVSAASCTRRRLIRDVRPRTKSTMHRAFIALLIVTSFPVQVRAQASRPMEITFEAFVDGPSSLHITPKGVYWTNGWAAKPGRISAKNLPTTVNGKEWTPRWIKDGDDRGEDRSDLLSMTLPDTDYTLEILGISDRKGSSKKDKRTQPSLVRRNGELCVDIPDPESGAKWYRIRLKPTKAK